MKTKNFFFMVCLLILGGISKGNAQNNVVLTTTQPDPGIQNVMVGAGTATPANNTVGPNGFKVNYNVFLGTGAGASTQSSALGEGSRNVHIGQEAGAHGTTASGSDNVYIGNWAGILANTQLDPGSSPSKAGTYNVAVGSASGYNLQGSFNTFLGGQAGGSINSAKTLTGSLNTFLGGGSGFANTGGSSNTFVGQFSGRFNTSGNNNTFVGLYSGDNIVTGSGNTFIGPVNANLGTTVPETSNTAILATCTDLWHTFQRLYIHNNGYAGFGLGNNIIPQNSLEVGTAFTPSLANTVGLRFTSFTTVSGAQSVFQPNLTGGVLSLNAAGDVIWVRDEVGTGPGGGSLKNECEKLNFATKTNASGNLSCTQIYDDWNGSPHPSIINPSGVAIGWSSPTLPAGFAYTVPAAPYSSTFFSPSNRMKLLVNGNIKSTGLWMTSDSNYKIEVEDLNKPLVRVLALKGHHYNWDVAHNPEMNFDDGIHAGFIAQEVEEVIPHVVMTQELENDKGDKVTRKSVNYIEIIPYLVEAIKEQQKQIEELRAELICINTKTASGCIGGEMKTAVQAANFGDTRIMSVSPNPTRDKANVVFNIEKGVDSASLQLFDINGNVLSSFIIKERDNNLSRTFEKNNYGTGTYIVSLIVNGKSIDSKKIIFE